tara:strand:+ start:126 stop:326 length:201 start_codon:yes stop_codon:yes gene_type:complete
MPRKFKSSTGDKRKITLRGGTDMKERPLWEDGRNRQESTKDRLRRKLAEKKMKKQIEENQSKKIKQ